jgi:hypothetical protein
LKSNTLVQKIAQNLLEGHFICQFTQPEHFKMLKSDVGIRHAVETCLQTLGRFLTMNPDETTFYAVHDKNTIDYKDESMRQFNIIRQKIRPTIGFLQTMANATIKPGETKVFIQGGQLIKVSDVIGGLSHNLAHIDTLTKLEWIKNKDAPLTEKVKTLFREAEKEGLIQLIDKVAERYIVTGKLDVMVETMLFIADSENLISGDSDSTASTADSNQERLSL